MRIAVIGAGPAGLLLGAALARRGHGVVAVDRDPGPPVTGRWERHGVMQFHHAHGFRAQVAEVLAEQWPQALTTWMALDLIFDAPDFRPLDFAPRALMTEAARRRTRS